MKKIICLLVVMGFWTSPALSIGEGEWRKHIIKAVDEFEHDNSTRYREFSFEAPMEWTGFCQQGQFDPAGSDICFYDGTENWMYAPQIHCDEDGYCVEYSSSMPGRVYDKKLKGNPRAAAMYNLQPESKGDYKCSKVQEIKVEGVDLALSVVCETSKVEKLSPYRRSLAEKKVALVRDNSITGVEVREYYGALSKDDLLPLPNLKKPVSYKDWRFKDIHDRMIASVRFSYKEDHRKQPKKSKAKPKSPVAGSSKKK